MEQHDDKALAIIAGRGAYPRVLAASARRQGVERIVAIAFKRETDRRIEAVASEVHWMHLGQLAPLLETLKASGVRRVVMAGQIKPTHLFNVRMDAALLRLLRGLKERNAHSIFGAIADELAAIGLELVEAHSYMEAAMPAPGPLTGDPLDEQQQADVALGVRVAKATSGLDIGQTVVIKAGTILAVEAFEGTDETIKRAGRLGGPGAVVVKAAKQGHDMRFDIPVIGERTLRNMKRARAAVLAVEAHRTILLDQVEMIKLAGQWGIRLIAVDMDRQTGGRSMALAEGST